MLLVISAAAYCAAAYCFANSRLADRLAECETICAELWAVLVTLAAPLTIPVELTAAAVYQARHAAAAARRFWESGRS